MGIAPFPWSAKTAKFGINDFRAKVSCKSCLRGNVPGPLLRSSKPIRIRQRPGRAMRPCLTFLALGAPAAAQSPSSISLHRQMSGLRIRPHPMISFPIGSIRLCTEVCALRNSCFETLWKAKFATRRTLHLGRTPRRPVSDLFLFERGLRGKIIFKVGLRFVGLSPKVSHTSQN